MNNLTLILRNSHIKSVPASFRLLSRQFKTKDTLNKNAKVELGENDEEANNKPVPFFESRAANWSTSTARSNTNIYDWPWYQPYVLSGSIAIFMLYFCVFREPNDIDDKLENGTLYDHIPGMEIVQLKLAYNQNLDNGKSVEEIKARLAALGHPVE